MHPGGRGGGATGDPEWDSMESLALLYTTSVIPSWEIMSSITIYHQHNTFTGNIRMYTHTHSSGNKSPRAKKMGYRRPDVQSTFLTTLTAGIGALRSEDWSPVTFPPSLWMATEISPSGCSCANSRFPGLGSKAGHSTQRLVRGKETSQYLKRWKRKHL